MRRSIVPWCTTLASAIVLGLSSFAGAAQSGQKPAGVASGPGADTYRLYCAVCHGERGKGNGPASPALRPRPSDLTTIARRNGTFPAAQVERTIRGTEPVVAHGSQRMMMWNALLLADANGDEASADMRVKALVRFIESLQVK